MTKRFTGISSEPFRFDEFGDGGKFVFAIYHRVRTLSCTKYVLEQITGVLCDQRIIPIVGLDFDLADLLATFDSVQPLDASLDTEENQG